MERLILTEIGTQNLLKVTVPTVLCFVQCYWIVTEILLISFSFKVVRKTVIYKH